MNPIYVVLPMFIVFFIILCTINQYTALEWILFLCFLCIIGIIGSQYFLGVELTTTLSSLFDPKVNVDIVTNADTDKDKDTDADTGMKGPEAYHIYGNFDYSMSKSICKAYDAKLATLSQIKDAYQNGGEWCDYGWSDDKMVLYPTQEESWKKYQDGKKDQCGIPGVNGGYNRRLNQRLGVNCYGVKPPGKVPIQVSPIETKLHLPKQGTLAPFNYKAWSQF